MVAADRPSYVEFGSVEARWVIIASLAPKSNSLLTVHRTQLNARNKASVPSHRLMRSKLLPLTTVAVFACGGDRPTDPGNSANQSAGIRTIAGSNQSDSAKAFLSQALVVEVRGPGGAILPGAVVRFDALPASDSSRRAERAVFVCRIDAPHCDAAWVNGGQFTVDTTDAKGHAHALVRLGTVAGMARVVAWAPATSDADTAQFTVLPAAASRVAFAVRDSTAYVGNSYRIGASVRDGYGNVLPQAPLSYALVGTAAALEDGDVFRASAVGRAGAAVKSGGLVDTAWVTVPPRGTIAVFNVGDGFSGKSGVAKVELDGSGYRMISQVPDTYWGTTPAGRQVGPWFSKLASASICRIPSATGSD